MMLQRNRRTAFSRVEFIVVVAIGTIVSGLFLFKVREARAAQARQDAAMNIKQMVIACHNHNDTHGKLPPAYDKFANDDVAASVHVHLLPYLAQDGLYLAYINAKGKGDVVNMKIGVFLASDDPSTTSEKQKGVQNFAASLRSFSTKGLRTLADADMPALGETELGTARIPATFRDGTSNTIVYATKYGHCGPKGGSWYAAAPNMVSAAFFGQNAAKVKAHPSDKTATFQLRPAAKDCCTSPLMAQSFTKAGLIIALCDGSTRTISPKLSAETWNAAVQPNDGQVLGKDWDN
jgi:hypothetical protein